MSPRLDVRKIGTRIVPCDSCKRQPNCAMYLNASRKMFHHQEYMQGTSYLTKCDIFVPNKTPGKAGQSRLIPPRGEGQVPT